MILAGSSDPGAKKYLKFLEKKSKLKFKFIKNFTVSPKKLKSIKLIITGAALGNSIDNQLIKWAKKNNIATIGIIENWSNLELRYLDKNKYTYPNHIFVNDLFCKEKLINFGAIKSNIHICGNILLERQTKEFKKNKNFYKFNLKNKKKLIFISQPLKEDFGSRTIQKLGYNEFKVLNLIKQKLSLYYELSIKLHPRDNLLKYDSFTNNFKILKRKKFTEIVNNYDLIIGMNSMLLIELGLIRDNVFSLMPLKKNEFIGTRLKIIKDIEHLVIDKKFVSNSPKFKLNKSPKLLTNSLQKTLEKINYIYELH